MARHLALSLLAALTLAGLPAAAADLDGTRWQLRLKGLRGLVLFWESDKLRFDGGNFTSEDCLPYGFAAGPYLEKSKGDAVTWSATQFNPAGETMEWSGARRGERMEGVFVWTLKDGRQKTFRWKARQLPPRKR